MVYSPLVRTAMLIAVDAHAHQTDKAGYPYIHHPLHLAESMPDEHTACAALLHDCLEDTALTLDDLRARGIPQAVLDALALLTRAPDEPYMDYVARLRQNPIARAVKMADLRHNSDLSRLDAADAPAQARARKYAQALALLSAP